MSKIEKLTCGQCTYTYVGETFRYLSTCFVEHNGKSIRIGQTLSNRTYNRIRTHGLQETHDFLSNNLSIIHKSELGSIIISESMLLKKFNPDLNTWDTSTK